MKTLSRFVVTTMGVLLSADVPADQGLPVAETRELVRLVRQDCGSCHGMKLTGGLGVPLTPAALRDKPLEGLAMTILYGRPGTAMPAWKTLLNERQAMWIAEQLVTGFPEETP